MGKQSLWKNLASSGALAGVLVWALSAATSAGMGPVRPVRPAEVTAPVKAQRPAAAPEEDVIELLRAARLRQRAEAARRAAAERAAAAQREQAREQARRAEQAKQARKKAAARKASASSKARVAAVRKARAAESQKQAARQRPARVASQKGSAVAASLADVELLARVIKIEAGGEPYEGKVAVGAVIVNRMRSSRFPNSLRAVVFAPGQFPGVTEMIDEVRPSASDIRAAKEALAGRDPSNGALYFYNPRIHRCEENEDDFLCDLKVTARIGNHVFAR
ncbi:MAG TPA: cell wall hydrolase [Thermaerobacter sp.]